MSFSWWIEDREGNDLLAGCSKDMSQLGESKTGDTKSEWPVGALRGEWCKVKYKEHCKEAAFDAFMAVRKMIVDNVNYSRMQIHDCPSCQCEIKPFGWSVEECNKVLDIDPAKVWRAGGGW